MDKLFFSRSLHEAACKLSMLAAISVIPAERAIMRHIAHTSCHSLCNRGIFEQ